jgi:lysophospholipase L1-like esterase
VLAFIVPVDARCPADILFIGDSHVLLNNWSRILGVDVCKIGIGGLTAKTMAQSIDRFVKGNPKRIYIMIGTNDVYARRPPAEEIIEDYIIILDYIQTNYPDAKIYVHSLLPPPSFRSYIFQIVEEFNNQLFDLALERGITFIDLHPEFEDENGFIIPYYGRIHLNRNGYQIWNDIVSHFLDSAEQ